MNHTSPLNLSSIKHILQTETETITSFDFHLFEEINSTNLFLKSLPLSDPTLISCCLAEMQTAGRGRFGKTWFSAHHEHIYCSIRFPAPIQSTGLSLVVGLSVLKTLKLLTALPDLTLKWPNDLLINHQKVCGILIEMGQKGSVIVGIGINVNGVMPKAPEATRPWCSLYEVSGNQYDRNKLIAHLLNDLNQAILQLNTRGFESFLKEWDTVDYLKNKAIQMSYGKDILTGYARGVTQEGALILEDEQGEMHQLISGEASLMNFI